MKIYIMLAVALIAGCAKKSNEVVPTYVSGSAYRSFSCEDLQIEARAIERNVRSLSISQDDRATQDAVTTGVGAVIFWPALFLLARGDDAEKLADLKGEYEAIQREMDRKVCAA